jgi:DNA uptake protein ComE-like DNA-binding protein
MWFILNFRLGKPKKCQNSIKVFKLAFAKKEKLIDINQATKEDLVKSMELAMLFLFGF